MKLIASTLLFGSLLILEGCTSTTTYYTPAYATRYNYTVGYYGGPYWTDTYYYGFNDVGNVGYWGMYDSYNVY